MKAVTPYPSSADTQTSQVAAGISASPFYAYSIISFILGMLMISISSMGQQCQFEAGEIDGPTNACAYIGGVGGIATYTIETTDASGFMWTVPAQCYLLSGQGTNSIRVKYKNTFSTGDVTVQVSNECDSAVTRSLRVGKARPATPASISGSAIVCDQVEAGTPVTYTVAPVPDAVSYRWAVPGQTTIVGGQGTETITVVFSSKFKSGDIKVRAVSGCGFSSYRAYAVTSKGPVTPGPVAGKSVGICPDEVVEYSVNPSGGASSYNWSSNIPGVVIVENGTTASVTFPAFSSGFINVTASNSCGNSGTRRLTVTSKGLKPASVSGPDSVCQATVQTFSVDSVPGAMAYNWSVPTGSRITEGEGTRSIAVEFGSEGGPVTVRAATLCDPGEPVSLNVIVETCGIEEPPLCELSVFPVPTRDLIHLTFCAQEAGEYHVTVADAITGCMVHCARGTYNKGPNEITTDLSHLKDGNYVLAIVTKEFTKTQRIEVKHCAGR